MRQHEGSVPTRILFHFLLFSLQAYTFAKAEGIFELRLLAFHNEFGKDVRGICCDGIDGDKARSDDSHCSGTCSTFFRICLKEYQKNISPDPPCTYGSRLTDILGGNSVDFGINKDSEEPLRFPFSFAWPGTFSVIIEAWHNSSFTYETKDDKSGAKQLIVRLAEQKSVSIGADWTTETHILAHTRLQFQYRVVCAEHYYGSNCMLYCRSRNDKYGHYSCSSDGTKICRDGWKGPVCDIAICKPGCHPSHGYCERPGECRCRLGFIGENCDQCQRYPGCQHGTCDEPFQCNCDEGWGGLFCNQDLNYCTHHRPCLNGGRCTNTGAGHFTCDCVPGYTGTTCELKIENCSQYPCANGATCIEQGSNYTCSCPESFSGRHCQVSARSCVGNPCANGATCVDTAHGFLCTCTPGWEGTNCDMERDECTSDPCQNGGRCIDDFNGFKCVCPVGFAGAQCEENINDCSATTCLNGGRCIDQVNLFKCECTPGFTGSLCQYNVDDCIKRPCANGGTCFDMMNDFRCMCRPGFKGKDCSIDINECESSPCRNGGTCSDLVDDYQCECPACFTGKNCNNRNDDCAYEHTLRPWIILPNNVTTSAYSVDGTLSGSAAFKDDSTKHLQVLAVYISIPLLVILIVVVIILIVVLWRYRRRQISNKCCRSSGLDVTDGVPSTPDVEKENEQNAKIDFYNNELSLDIKKGNSSTSNWRPETLQTPYGAPPTMAKMVNEDRERTFKIKSIRSFSPERLHSHQQLQQPGKFPCSAQNMYCQKQLTDTVEVEANRTTPVGSPDSGLCEDNLHDVGSSWSTAQRVPGDDFKLSLHSSPHSSAQSSQRHYHCPVRHASQQPRNSCGSQNSTPDSGHNSPPQSPQMPSLPNFRPVQSLAQSRSASSWGSS